MPGQPSTSMCNQSSSPRRCPGAGSPPIPTKALTWAGRPGYPFPQVLHPHPSTTLSFRSRPSNTAFSFIHILFLLLGIRLIVGNVATDRIDKTALNPCVLGPVTDRPDRDLSALEGDPQTARHHHDGLAFVCDSTSRHDAPSEQRDSSQNTSRLVNKLAVILDFTSITNQFGRAQPAHIIQLTKH